MAGLIFCAPALAQTVLTRTPSGILALKPGSSYSGTPANIHDGSTTSAWVSNYAMSNVFQFAFDPNLNGTSGLAGDER
jgi:hypothetical protein